MSLSFHQWLSWFLGRRWSRAVMVPRNQDSSSGNWEKRGAVKRGLGEQGWGCGSIKAFPEARASCETCSPPTCPLKSQGFGNSSNSTVLFCGPHKLPKCPGMPALWHANHVSRRQCPLPRNGPKFFVRTSARISRWENVVTVNFMEGGIRIETTKLFSRKHKFIKIAKSFPNGDGSM